MAIFHTVLCFVVWHPFTFTGSTYYINLHLLWIPPALCGLIVHAGRAAGIISS